MRQLATEEMKRLVDKYPDRFDGWDSVLQGTGDNRGQQEVGILTG